MFGNLMSRHFDSSSCIPSLCRERNHPFYNYIIMQELSWPCGAGSSHRLLGYPSSWCWILAYILSCIRTFSLKRYTQMLKLKLLDTSPRLRLYNSLRALVRHCTCTLWGPSVCQWHRGLCWPVYKHMVWDWLFCSRRLLPKSIKSHDAGFS